MRRAISATSASRGQRATANGFQGWSATSSTHASSPWPTCRRLAHVHPAFQGHLPQTAPLLTIDGGRSTFAPRPRVADQARRSRRRSWAAKPMASAIICNLAVGLGGVRQCVAHEADQFGLLKHDLVSRRNAKGAAHCGQRPVSDLRDGFERVGGSGFEQIAGRYRQLKIPVTGPCDRQLTPLAILKLNDAQFRFLAKGTTIAVDLEPSLHKT